MCCAGADIRDARRVAAALDIPHYRARLRTAVSQCRDGPIRRQLSQVGETPIPCVLCNQSVKFSDLLGTARDLGGDILATGHYVRRIEGRGGPELHCAAESCPGPELLPLCHDIGTAALPAVPAWRHDQAGGEGVRDPVGTAGLRPSPTARIFASFPKADMPMSSTGCARVPSNPARSSISTTTCWVITRGIVHYTVGQRRRLGIAVGEPLYVVRLDPDRHRVVVGPRAGPDVDRSHRARCQLAGFGHDARGGRGLQREAAVRTAAGRGPCRPPSREGAPGSNSPCPPRRSHPVRPVSSTTPAGCWVAGGSKGATGCRKWAMRPYFPAACPRPPACNNPSVTNMWCASLSHVPVSTPQQHDGRSSETGGWPCRTCPSNRCRGHNRKIHRMRPQSLFDRAGLSAIPAQRGRHLGRSNAGSTNLNGLERLRYPWPLDRHLPPISAALRRRAASRRPARLNERAP